MKKYLFLFLCGCSSLLMMATEASSDSTQLENDLRSNSRVVTSTSVGATQSAQVSSSPTAPDGATFQGVKKVVVNGQVFDPTGHGGRVRRPIDPSTFDEMTSDYTYAQVADQNQNSIMLMSQARGGYPDSDPSTTTPVYQNQDNDNALHVTPAVMSEPSSVNTAAMAVGYSDNTLSSQRLVLIGDINADGVMSVSDVTGMIDGLLDGSITINGKPADVDGDGQVTIADVTAIIDQLLGGAVK